MWVGPARRWKDQGCSVREITRSAPDGRDSRAAPETIRIHGRSGARRCRRPGTVGIGETEQFGRRRPAVGGDIRDKRTRIAHATPREDPLGGIDKVRRFLMPGRNCGGESRADRRHGHGSDLGERGIVRRTGGNAANGVRGQTNHAGHACSIGVTMEGGMTDKYANRRIHVHVTSGAATFLRDSVGHGVTAPVAIDVHGRYARERRSRILRVAGLARSGDGWTHWAILAKFESRAGGTPTEQSCFGHGSVFSARPNDD